MELVRRFTEGFNELGIDGVIELIAPDWVGHPFRGWIGDPVYRGREGMRELTAIWTENFDDYRVEIRDLIAVGDRVLALLEHGGVAKHASAPVGEPMAAIFGSFANGMVAETSFFLSWEEGRQAAGLSK